MLTFRQIDPAGYTRAVRKQAELRGRVLEVLAVSRACEWSPSWTFELKLSLAEVLADLHHGRD